MAGVGDINISSNFELDSQRPSEAKYLKADITARDASPLVQRYDGYPVYIESTKETYKLILGTVDSDLANNLNWVNVTLIPGVTNISNFVNDLNYTVEGANISVFTNDAGYLTSFTESDPIFVTSPANGITSGDIVNWDIAFGWGNHASKGYLTTETDPTVPSHVKSITTGNITDWGTAYTHSQVTTGNPHNLDSGDVNSEPVISPKNSAFNKDFGSGTTDVARGDHVHTEYINNYFSSAITLVNVPGTVTNNSIVERMNFGNPVTDNELVVLRFNFSSGTTFALTNGMQIGSVVGGFIPSIEVIASGTFQFSGAPAPWRFRIATDGRIYIIAANSPNAGANGIIAGLAVYYKS